MAVKVKWQIAVINCELSCFDINLTFHMLFNIHLNSESHCQDPMSYFECRLQFNRTKNLLC